LTICSATRAGLAREELRRCLAHRLKIPSVSLQDPIFERADPDHWNTRETAEALLARLSRLTNGRFEKPAQPSFEQRLQDALDMAVRDLVEGMNPEVCRSALRGGRINAAIYNYLIPEEHRTYRMQFAATFPILLLPMATALAGTAEADIRLAVDRGIPLTRSLAARWRIRPAVVRFLVGKTPDIVGAQWESNLAGLARLLDALRPEDLPGNRPDAWAAFNRAVALAQRIFRRRSWASPAALAWLREVARGGGYAKTATRKRWLWDPSPLRLSIGSVTGCSRRFLPAHAARAPAATPGLRRTSKKLLTVCLRRCDQGVLHKSPNGSSWNLPGQRRICRPISGSSAARPSGR
jgi:hypothetical protein